MMRCFAATKQIGDNAPLAIPPTVSFIYDMFFLDRTIPATRTQIGFPVLTPGRIFTPKWHIRREIYPTEIVGQNAPSLRDSLPQEGHRPAHMTWWLHRHRAREEKLPNS